MRPFLIVALAAAIVVSLAPSAKATTPRLERVMIVGDSVTHGSDGDYTWRYFAWKSLEENGAYVDFVGPHQGTFKGDGAVWDGSYADPAFDQDHASRWGLAMAETLYWSEETPESLMAHNPDVVVEMLGVNDFVWLGQTAEGMTNLVREFVARVRAIKPDTDIVIGSLPQVWIREVESYNALLPNLADELTTAESRVVSTPVPSFVEGEDTYDPAHPNTQGQQKIAASVTEALRSLGIGNAPVFVPVEAVPVPVTPVKPQTLEEVIAPPEDAQVPPSTPRRVRATRKGNQVLVTWRASLNADRYVVKCGIKKRNTSNTRIQLRSRSGYCKVRAVNTAGASAWMKAKVRSI